MFTLHNGDCLEYMRSLPSGSVSAIITDPPYGIKRDKGFGGSQPFGGGDGKSIDRVEYHGNWDDVRPSKEVFEEMQRIAKTVIIFGGNFFADLLPVGNHWVVWDKLNTMPTFGDCELVWTNVKRNSVKTQLAPDAGDSAVSTGSLQASALSTSQAESAPTQRG